MNGVMSFDQSQHTIEVAHTTGAPERRVCSRRGVTCIASDVA
jgi:hypothetical protein